MYIDCELVNTFMKYLNSKDAIVIEKAYYILGNLVADSYEIAIEVSLNPSIMSNLKEHSERKEFKIIYYLCFFLKNISIKIEHLPSQSFFLSEISVLFDIIKEIILKFDIKT